ncbi:hypothetical protein YC2023_082194 [Brassica napus]
MIRVCFFALLSFRHQSEEENSPSLTNQYPFLLHRNGVHGQHPPESNFGFISKLVKGRIRVEGRPFSLIITSSSSTVEVISRFAVLSWVLLLVKWNNKGHRSGVIMHTTGDALYELKKSLVDDPNNVLQSWDATLVSPCTWFHITCNSENSVIRL